VVTQTDLVLGDGRTLHAYDALADGADARLAVLWHHGTPNLGAPPEPLFPAADRLGIRWVSYNRPGYGGSTPHPGRDVATAAVDAVCASGLAPYHAQGLDWFGGMGAAGAAELRAAARGRVALQEYLGSAEYDPELFTPADHAALAGPWSWLLTVVEQAMEGGLGGMVDDDLAYVAPWRFDPAQVRPPVLFLHGGQDRMVPSSHGEWLARQTRSAELWLRPDEGHVSILSAAEAALGWLREQASQG
jgi:pimeloyl-ACP methyl ester carboxylesterase